MKYTVRKMNMDDVKSHDGIQHLYSIQSETKFFDVPVHLPTLARYMVNTLKNPNKVIFVVETEDGEKVGCIHAWFSRFWYSDKLVSDAEGLYVKKEHRNLSVVTLLVRAYEEWARSKEVDKIHLGISFGVNIDRTAKVFESFGYEKTGYAFSKMT